MGEYYRNNSTFRFYKGTQMKTVEEIKKELSNMELLFKQDRTFLANETYGYILALKWVLDEEQ